VVQHDPRQHLFARIFTREIARKQNECESLGRVHRARTTHHHSNKNETHPSTILPHAGGGTHTYLGPMLMLAMGLRDLPSLGLLKYLRSFAAEGDLE